MWFVKKAASKVKKASQSVFRQQSQIQKLIKDIISNRHEVMPTKQMSILAEKSFEIQNFENCLEFIVTKLKDINFQKKSLKKRLNLLVLSTYLIKYGASGFIDEFRANIQAFTQYQNLQYQENVKQFNDILSEINNRVKYIKVLLQDKSVLFRQKEVGRLIRQKLKVSGGDYSRQNPNESQPEHIDQQKVESFLQHYVWRYTAKLDKKINDITDALISKIDTYLDGEMPQSFDIDEIQQQKEKSIANTEFYIEGIKQTQKEKIFIQQKVPLQIAVRNTNLLDLQQNSNIQKKQVDLIDLNQKSIHQKQQNIVSISVSDKNFVNPIIKVGFLQENLEQQSNKPETSLPKE